VPWFGMNYRLIICLNTISIRTSKLLNTILNEKFWLYTKRYIVRRKNLGKILFLFVFKTKLLHYFSVIQWNRTSLQLLYQILENSSECLTNYFIQLKVFIVMECILIIKDGQKSLHSIRHPIIREVILFLIFMLIME
jgi:hypothetical protein